VLNAYGKTYFKLKPARGNIFIHWMRKNHIPQMLEIEASCSERFWGSRDFDGALSKLNIQGYVACCLNRVIGFIVYKMMGTINVLNMGVHPDYRLKDIDTLLLNKLKKNMKRRTKIRFAVRESNLHRQVLLRENKFEANTILKNHFKNEWSDGVEMEDGYVFEYTITRKKEKEE